jgi:hypothetical protein
MIRSHAYLSSNSGQVNPGLPALYDMADEQSRQINEPDFEVADHGSISLLRPMNEAARNWVAEHLPPDAMRWAGSIAVEHRFIEPIVNGLLFEGYEVAEAA